MKRVLLHIALLAWLSGSVVDGYSQQVVELKQPLSSKIVIKLMFRNGSMVDPKGKEGLTLATANMITGGGTQKMTRKEIREFIYPMAASYNNLTDKEVSTFTFSVHKDFAEKFYPIMRDLILSPRFSEEDFAREKSNQQNYVDEVIRASSDEDYSKKALEDLLFRGTPYQHMVEGTSSGVKSITLDDIKNHYKSYFTRDNLIIGIAGNFSSQFLQRLKKDLSALPKSTSTPGFVRPIGPNGIRVEIISKKDALGSAIFMGAPLDLTRKNDDFAALMVANSYLGEHRKSYGRLYDQIRATRSMNYGSYSYIEWYHAGGNNMLPVPGVPRNSNYYSMWIRPVQTAEALKKQYAELKDIKTGHAHFAIRLALREMDRMITNGMSQKDFEDTRKFLRSYNKLYVQTPDRQLGFLLDSRFYGRKNYINEVDALLAKLTVEDVNRAMKKYWQVKNVYITIVTDDSETTALAESLRNNDPSPMSYSNIVKEGLPAAVTKEDEEISNYKLNVRDVRVVESAEMFR
jgi:zinc protease